MGARLLPRNLPEVFAYALALEREAAKRLSEIERFLRRLGAERAAQVLESIAREEQDQYQLLALGTCGPDLPELAGWELAAYFPGKSFVERPQPKGSRDALRLALGFERCVQAFYLDVAEHARNDAVRAFCAEMSVEEGRHVALLEELLEREAGEADDDGTAAVLGGVAGS